jgi:KUP system potassium uptake protein
LGVLGLVEVLHNPGVLRRSTPAGAVGLFGVADIQAIVAPGAIVLAITGAEALYADMGHFGRAPIRAA